MTTVGMRELKEKTRAVIDRARNGEEVGITYRGEVVARIVPAPRVITPRKKLSAAWMTMDELAARVGASQNTSADWRREL